MFFLASGLTFSLLLAAIPFLVLLLAVAGLILGPRMEAPRGAVLTWLSDVLPLSPALMAELRRRIADLVEVSRSVGLISGVLFAWFSTRLFGALRTVLEQVFDLRGGPGILKAKVLDLRLVVISTVLLSANVAITTSFLALSREVIERLPIPTGPPLWIVGHLTAFAAILLMFFLIYKFVPGRRLKWRIALVAALVAAVGFELLKAALGWYLANVADFSRVFFAFATVVVVVVSFYYGSVVFILGGEVGKVYGLRRAMHRQRESFGSS